MLTKKKVNFTVRQNAKNTPFSKSENDKNSFNFINPQDQLLTKYLKNIKTQKMSKTVLRKKFELFSGSSQPSSIFFHILVKNGKNKNRHRFEPQHYPKRKKRFRILTPGF